MENPQEESHKIELAVLVVTEVQKMMKEGDRAYLRGLERSALLDVLESELRFMGLYSHRDQETPRMIRTILEERIDQLCDDYLYGAEVTIQGPNGWMQTASANELATSSDNVAGERGKVEGKEEKTLKFRFSTPIVPHIQGIKYRGLV